MRPRRVPALLLGALLQLLATASGASYPARPAGPSVYPSDPRMTQPIPSREHDDADPRYRDYDLEHVDLSLRFDIDRRWIEGKVGFDLRSLRQDCAEILLDLVDTLRVTSVTRDGVSLAFVHADRQLHVYPRPPLALGESARIVVGYEGFPQPDGFLGLAFDEQGALHPCPLISTLSETNSAPAWWPCKDVTYDKFLLDARFTVPDTLTAASNGVLVEVLEEPGGMHTFHWRESHPIATYLVSLAATDYTTWQDVYVSSDGRTMPVVYYAYPESEEKARTAWARTPEMISHFAGLFGEYPFLDEKYGMAEFNWGGGMENQTMTSYGAYLLEFDQDSNEQTVSHELAHQWWGDEVTPGMWSDIWLNEGFATYGESLWREHVAGFPGYQAHMRELYRDSFDGPLVPPDYEFSPTTYFKGAWVLHMLRGVLGSDTFFRGLREYRREFSGRPASSRGLQRALERVSGADLARFFRSWVYGTGMPFYDISWNWPSSSGDPGWVDVTVAQTQPDSVFEMPVQLVFLRAGVPAETLAVRDSLRVQTFPVHLGGKPIDVLFDPQDWILKHLRYLSGPTVAVAGEEGSDGWRFSPPRPNPFAGTVRLLVTSPASTSPSGPWPGQAGGVAQGPWRFRVFDASGRTLAHLEPSASNGGLLLEWDGRTGSGLPAPAGVYWVAGTGGAAGEERLRARVVLVR